MTIKITDKDRAFMKMWADCSDEALKIKTSRYMLGWTCPALLEAYDIVKTYLPDIPDETVLCHAWTEKVFGSYEEPDE